MNRIDKFCYQHPRFGIPNLMLVLAIGTGIVWLVSAIDTNGILLSTLAFSPYKILHGQVWRLLTFLFIPQYSGISLFIMLYFYYFIGTSLERQWGSAKFNVYFFSGVLFMEIFSLVSYLVADVSIGITTYYLLYSLLFAFAVYYGDNIVRLFFIIPIKMKYFAFIGAAMMIYDVFRMLSLPFPTMLLPIVAVLNFLLFCGSTLFRPFSLEDRKQRTQRTNFNNEMRRMRHVEKSNSYTRKCAVCGRTDASNPEMEFRYCSRCEGYHCFCIDHINNHVHFTE